MRPHSTPRQYIKVTSSPDKHKNIEIKVRFHYNNTRVYRRLRSVSCGGRITMPCPLLLVATGGGTPVLFPNFLKFDFSITNRIAQV